MKAKKFVLALASFLAVTTALGCSESSTGGTIADATSGAAAPAAASSTNFTPADPVAKKAMDDKVKAEADAATNTKPAAEQKEQASTEKAPDTAAPNAKMPKAGEKVAVLDTNLGRIVLKFFPDKAPGHVKNFVKLTEKKFYDGTKFHRVIPGFMIQGGDPYSKTNEGPVGTGGPGYQIKAEFNDVHHTRGILSMARSSDPDSAGSQFFICVADAPSLDNQYTVFGNVIEGMDVVDKIVNLPRDGSDKPTPDEAIMTKVHMETWPLKK